MIRGGRPPLILASSSPRRRDLLASIGVVFEPRPANIDENVLPGEAPRDLVRRLALEKALAVAASSPDQPVLAADTVVVVDGRILGKPADADQNRAFLRDLQGRTHTVHTGHALVLDGRRTQRVVDSLVEFRPLGDDELERYVASGEGLDKAGGYGIQGLGAILVRRIDGCYSNIVGLSLPTVVALAGELGVELV